MRKAAVLAAAKALAAATATAARRSHRFHGGSFSLLFPSLSSSSLITTSPHPFASLFSQNKFFISTHRSTTRTGRIETDEEDWNVEWEEEEDREAAIGDGGDGGGIVLGDVKWGEYALFLANEVLLGFGDSFSLYAFRVSPKGYVYVRLDKLTNRLGCPDIEEIENFNNLYKNRLDEAGKDGTIPADLALEVSSPGAERLLKVPQDLERFQEMAMWVSYLDKDEETKLQKQQKDKVLVLESVDSAAERCIFKLADVRENRAELGKGRLLNRKQRDWRLDLPFKSILRIKVYLDSR